MPQYNFKSQFAGAVERGEKRQTIRPRRKRFTKPGDTLYLFTGLRTRQARRLRTETCIDVQSIRIYDLNRVAVDGNFLSQKEVEQLALADGFETAAEFFAFFERQYGLPADGLVLIKW